MSEQHNANPELDASDDLLADVYGPPADLAEREPPIAARRTFAPWHHPIKQLVRQRQWAQLTNRLLGRIPARPESLRVFTLPGADLLDIRVLSDVTAGENIPVEFFGFDSTASTGYGEADGASRARAELRQSGRIIADSQVIRGRLEEIALTTSHAAQQLRQQEPFHVINIDLCSHLTARHQDGVNAFDALEVLLTHQLRAQTEWLLFVTTRCDSNLLADAGEKFKKAIKDNLALSPDLFGIALAEAVEVELERLDDAVAECWASADRRFLKFYCIGLSKFLLQWCNGQVAFRPAVELASAYAYAVRAGRPDMLALAFRITPTALQVFPPSTGGGLVVPDLEPRQAVQVARKAAQLWMLDEAIEEPAILQEAVEGTEELLRRAHYDIAEWRRWVQSHSERPLDLGKVHAA